MNIIFVRHGESKHNANPINKNEEKGLTDKGRKQAEALGKSLKKYRISEIYTSQLLRAKQTGKIISVIINVPIKESLEELNEYHVKQIKSRLQAKLNKEHRKKIKGLKNLFSEITKDKEEDKNVLIVAHGNTNRIIISHFLRIPLSKRIFWFSQHNTCVNILKWTKNKHWSLRRLNDINHLPLKLRDK